MTSWIDDDLAMAPMPAEGQIADLAQTFKAVVTLIEDWQFGYDPQLWHTFGTDMLHLPIPDFGTPRLEELSEAVDWINREIAAGKKVLVHCLVGRGRSGTVAAAYLISKGFDADDAIQHVRRHVHGAIETCEQEELLRRFDRQERGTLR
jgi:protein-tyrosine phosphatase